MAADCWVLRRCAIRHTAVPSSIPSFNLTSNQPKPSRSCQHPQGAGGGAGTASATGGPTAGDIPACCRCKPSSILSRSCFRMYQIQNLQDRNTSRGTTEKIHRKRVTLNLAMTSCRARVRTSACGLGRAVCAVSVSLLEGKGAIIRVLEGSELWQPEDNVWLHNRCQQPRK